MNIKINKTVELQLKEEEAQLLLNFLKDFVFDSRKKELSELFRDIYHDLHINLKGW
jgi:hypothetical protein